MRIIAAFILITKTFMLKASLRSELLLRSKRSRLLDSPTNTGPLGSSPNAVIRLHPLAYLGGQRSHQSHCKERGLGVI